MKFFALIAATAFMLLAASSSSAVTKFAYRKAVHNTTCVGPACVLSEKVGRGASGGAPQPSPPSATWTAKTPSSWQLALLNGTTLISVSVVEVASGCEPTGAAHTVIGQSVIFNWDAPSGDAACAGGSFSSLKSSVGAAFTVQIVLRGTNGETQVLTDTY